MSCISHIYADDGQLHLSFEPERAVHTIDEINILWSSKHFQAVIKQWTQTQHWQVHNTLPARTFIQSHGLSFTSSPPPRRHHDCVASTWSEVSHIVIMSSVSNAEVLLLVLLIKKITRRTKQRRYNVYPILISRKDKRFYYTLFNELTKTN